MNRTGFTASPLKAQVTSSSKKLFLIRLPKGTDLNILDGVEFDVTKGKVDNIYKDEESEYNCYMDPNVSRDFVRPLVCKSSSDSLSVGSKLEGTFTITRKFTPPPRIEANVRLTSYDTHCISSLTVLISLFSCFIRYWSYIEK